MSFVFAVPKLILTAVNSLVPDNKSSIKQNDGMYLPRHRVWEEVVETLAERAAPPFGEQTTGWEWGVSTVLQSQQCCGKNDLPSLPEASMLGRVKVKL